MARIWRTASLAVLAGLLSTGCLLKVETHTWYLEPGNGEVTWVVLEQDVRSDANAAADRDREELEFWNDVQAANHSTARALREVGALGLETRVLRSRVPFSILTQATFPTIDELGRRLITLSGLSGFSTLTRDGDLVEWTLSVRDPQTVEAPSNDDVTALLCGLSSLRVVLSHGRFEAGTGFTFDSDRRVAHFEEPDDETGDSELVVLRLSWTSAPGRD